MDSRRRLELETSLCAFLERKRGAVKHEATTVMNTFPDRVVSKNIKVEHLNSEVIPGIPTHLLLEFSASMEPPERGVTGLKRTATFELDSDKLLDEKVQT